MSSQPSDETLQLSLCIATFNRAGFIGATLQSILGQCNDAVEVVILDGGSSDDTAGVVRQYAQRYPCVRYFRQEVNRGVDPDFDRAVGEARGRYCWLMTDDDLLRPGAIDTVLDAIRQDYALIIVNAEVRNQDMSAVLQPQRLAATNDQAYRAEEMDRLFQDAGEYLTFIGCVVIRRSVWLARERQRFYGSLFIHVAVIFQQRLPAATLLIARPLISIRYGNAMWRPKEFEIWMFKWPVLIWSLPGLSENAKQQNCRAEPWRSVKTLLLYRARGTYSLEEYRRWIRPRLHSLPARGLAALVACLPGLLANVAGLLYYTVAGRRGGMGMLDMKNSRFYPRHLLALRRQS